MRRVITTLMATLLALSLYGQGAYDAFKFSQYRYEGSARSIAMGNAFTSLGGDSYAISINPASSAVMNSSQFAFTPSLAAGSSEAGYFHLSNSERESWAKVGLSNLAMVSTIKSKDNLTPLKSFSFGVAVNKLNNYNSRLYLSGFDDQTSWLASLADGLYGVDNSYLDISSSQNPFDYSDLAWREILAWNTNLIDPLDESGINYIAVTENIVDNDIFVPAALDQRFSREQKGSINEALFNFSFNISNIFYVGANIGVQSLEYVDYQRYSESAQNSYLFDTGFESFNHYYRQTTNGVGANLKVGFIYLPVEGLRLGASLSTPTWLILKDSWDEEMESKFDDGYKSSVISPIGEFNYRVNSPARWNIGLSYVFAKRALISFDYEGVNYSSMRMLSYHGDRELFRDSNQEIANSFRSSSILRAGVEVRATDRFSLRAGYMYYTNPERGGFGQELNYYSGGFGYSSPTGTFLDVGFQIRGLTSDSFTLYNDYGGLSAPRAYNDSSDWKLLLTWGFRF